MTAPRPAPHRATRNGVSVSGLFETIAAVKDNRELAKFRFRANNRWIDGGHSRSTIQGFFGCGQENMGRAEPFIIDADEPPIMHGRDSGANPVEILLHALIACLTTTMIYHASARGIEIETVESSIEGDLDLRGFLDLSDEVRKGYQDIRIRMRVTSDADPDLLRELALFSPVHDVVAKSVPVEVMVVTA
jgi:uncharacterized OsmC-like protein